MIIRWLQILIEVHKFDGKNTEMEFGGMYFVAVGCI